MSDITVTTTEGGTTVVTDTLGAATAAAAAAVSAAAAATSASNASTSASNAASSASAASASASTATTQAGNASTSASAAASSASAASTSASNAATSASQAAASAAFLNPAAVAITGGTINNTAIGGTTAAAGSFTTLSSDSLNATSATGSKKMTIGGTARWNLYRDDAVTGDLVVDADGSGTNVARFKSTGLAVAGTLSATGNVTLGDAAGDVHTANGSLSILGATSITAAQSTLQQTSSTGTNPVVHSLANTGGTYYLGVNDSSAVQFGGNAYSLVRYAPATRTIQDIIGGTGAITTVSSTGLSVTGMLSSTGKATLGASAGGEQIATTSVTTFSGGSGYQSFYAEGTERLRVGWKNAGADAGLVPAQILMTESVNLTIASRDNAAGSVFVKAGSGIPTVGTFTSSGFAVAGTISASGITSVTDTTDATSTTAASLKTAGGLAVAKKLYVGDNIVIASGKGIDFSATANGSGTTTSEVLSDYEEGTWTPTDASGSGLSITKNYAVYTKVGRKVTAVCDVTFPGTASGASAGLGGLPFTVAAGEYGVTAIYQNSGATAMLALATAASTNTALYNAATSAPILNSELSDDRVIFTVTYNV